MENAQLAMAPVRSSSKTLLFQKSDSRLFVRDAAAPVA
jgi:hypothetical protein